MILELQFVTYICNFFIIVTWSFHVRIFFPFLVILTWHVHVRNLFRFWLFSQKVIVSCFLDSFYSENDSTIRCNCIVTSDSRLLYNLLKNPVLISANAYENYIVSKAYCIARHDDKMCFLPNCRYHLILIDKNTKVIFSSW